MDDYWVNSRNTGSFALTATMSSTFIGASAIFAMAGIAYEGGFSGFYLGLSFVLYFILFALFFAPKIQKLGTKYNIYTLPEAFGLRYGHRVRVVSAIVSLIAFGLFMGVQFLAIGSLVSLFADMSLSVATFIGGAILIAYISMGGLRADIRTDIFQFIIMILLVLIFVPMLITEGGGLIALKSLPTGFWSGEAFMPIPMLIFAFILLGPTVLVGSDVWQRALAAKSPQVAKKGMLFSGLFLVPFFVMATFIGVYGYLLYPEVGANHLIFTEVVNILPVGLIGVALAGFLAAVMSSADTVLLVLSQTLVNDLSRKKFEPEKLLKYSRMLSLIIGFVALTIALVLLNLVDVAISAASFQIALLPSAFGLFFWKRATAKAAFLSILFGALTMLVTLPILAEEAFLPGFIVSALVFFIGSYFTKHSDEEKVLKEST